MSTAATPSLAVTHEPVGDDGAHATLSLIHI